MYMAPDLVENEEEGHCLVPELSGILIGRESLQQELHQKLQEHLKETETTRRVLVIFGPKEVGKSELVKHFASNYRREYPYILWLDAGLCATLYTGFVQAATELKLCQDILRKARLTSDDRKIVVSAVFNAFASGRTPGLIIFDNVQALREVTRQPYMYPNIPHFLGLQSFDQLPLFLAISAEQDSEQIFPGAEIFQVPPLKEFQALELFSLELGISPVPNHNFQIARKRQLKFILGKLNGLPSWIKEAATILRWDISNFGDEQQFTGTRLWKILNLDLDDAPTVLDIIVKDFWTRMRELLEDKDAIYLKEFLRREIRIREEAVTLFEFLCKIQNWINAGEYRAALQCKLDMSNSEIEPLYKLAKLRLKK